MIKFKSSASSVVVTSIFVIHLMNGAQFLNITQAAIFPAIIILLFTKK